MCRRRPACTSPATAGWWSTGPAAEDEFERVEDGAVAGLFGTLSFQLFQAQRDDTALQGEIWRLFLFLMLLALVVEAWLIRPGSMAEAVPPKPQPAAA